MIQGIPVFDFHAHFPNSGEWFPDYPPSPPPPSGPKPPDKQAERWRKAYNLPAERIQVEDDGEASDRWYQDLVEKQVERIVFVSGGGNERLARIVARHPDRFLGFAHHNPFGEHAAPELERGVAELGMKGYKILAPALSRSIADPALDKLWKSCLRARVPVLIHFGILGAGGGIGAGLNINPLGLHEVAKRFPEIPFIVPHFGAGYPTELLHLCWTCPNVYADSSGSNQWVRWMAYPLSLTDLFRRFYETVGADRILFGTDSSWFPRAFCSGYLEEQHRIMRFLGFPESDLEKILYRNAARLLHLELE